MIWIRVEGTNTVSITERDHLELCLISIVWTCVKENLSPMSRITIVSYRSNIYRSDQHHVTFYRSDVTDVCRLPTEVGPCNVPVTKWRYDRERGSCVEFTFGGCHGNANKFDTMADCASVCPVTGTRRSFMNLRLLFNVIMHEFGRYNMN